MAYQAKRAFPRNISRDGVKIRSSEGILFATYEDLSAGGVKLFLDYDIPVHSVVEIQFTLRSPTGQSLSEVRTLGKIVRSFKKSNGYEAGLQFIDLQPTTRRIIESMVDQKDGPF